MKNYMYMLLLIGIISGCTISKTDTTNLINDNFNSTLWIQSAAEYKANSIQSYNSATNILSQAKSDVTWTAILEQKTDYKSLPSAIVLDIDETVLDNSQYQAQLVLSSSEYKSETWDRWISLRSAPAIPGAVKFINKAKEDGIEVIYITNRECKPRDRSNDFCPQKQDTIENLKKVGIRTVSSQNLLLKKEKEEWTSEKKSRREAVAINYRVIMLFGDDLGDFLPDVKKNITPQERDALVSRYESNWGIKWFSFPNPSYGSWLGVLNKPKENYLNGY